MEKEDDGGAIIFSPQPSSLIPAFLVLQCAFASDENPQTIRLIR